MPDGRPALTGAQRKRRFDRRERLGLINFRGDLPPEIGEWLMDRGHRAEIHSADTDDWGDAEKLAI